MPFHPLYLIIVVPVALLIGVVTHGTPPDLTGIAAIITACIGVVGFLATLFRGKNNNKRVEEVESAASYVKGFESLIDNLQSEIKDLRNDVRASQQSNEAAREEFEGKFRVLNDELTDALIAKRTMQAELLELRGQIRGYLNTEQWDEFNRHGQ